MTIQNRLKNKIMALSLYPISAYTYIKGIKKYSNINGYMTFQQMAKTVLVSVYVEGLPYKKGACNGEIFGFHIHSGKSCTGTKNEPLKDADGHFNPNNCKHRHHAGDMPPLFGNNGEAFMTFETNRFSVREIINRVVIIHRNPDDFTTQPSGDSGEMIACGKIYKK